MDRKLTTIFAADIAGYADIMHRDEERAHVAFRVCCDVMVGTVARHNGRVFGGAGDSVMAEFDSPIEALRAALETQQALAVVPLDLPTGCRMQFRIGIHLGDVMIDREELYGDGVNVAARLQGLADPGGVFISDTVHGQVKNLLRLNYVDLGPQQLKNISDPVHVFRVLSGPGRARRMPIPRVAAALVIIVLLAGGGVATWWQNRSPDDASGLPGSQSVVGAPLPARPSIAILPFENLSGDQAQDYFSAGLTSDITTDLSKFANLFVIAYNSAATYKGKAVKAQDVGRDLGVRYFLEGTVQKSSGKLRINCQLIDATSGHHLWAERYERTAEDLFAVQDEIIRAVVSILAIKVNEAELRRVTYRETSNMGAYDLWLQAKAIFADPKKQSKEGNDEARKLLDEAIRLDSKFARAHGFLSYVLVRDWQNDWSDQPGIARTLALQSAEEAVRLDPGDYDGYWSRAIVYASQGSIDDSLDEYAEAIKRNGNDPDLLAEMGEVLIQAGRGGDAIARIDDAIAHNPIDTPYWYYWVQARAYYMVKRYDDAITAIQKISDPPYDVWLILGACYARQGKFTEAQAEVQKFLDNEPDWTVEDSSRYVWKKSEDQQHWLDGLCLAGLPSGNYNCPKP